MKTEYKTIGELLADINDKKIDPAKLRIIVDNDHTGFYYEVDDDTSITLKVHTIGNGQYDVYPMYEYLFPNSMVDVA
jgi:hypothetical protein